MILGRRGRAALWLSIALVTACGGGGGSGSAPSQPSTPTATNLQLLDANLPEPAVAVSVSTDSQWLFSFDMPIASDGVGTLVELRSTTGTAPVSVDVLNGSLRVRPTQELRLRTEYTLTVNAGIKASNGATLRADIVRHFRTVLFDGINRVVQPANNALVNYSGQHTLRIGDLNGDGRPDIVQIGGDAALTQNYEGNSFAINIFLQNADHSFTRSQNLLVHESQHVYSNRMGDIAIVDLDHDGVPEIVVSILRPRYDPSGLMVFKQDAQGRYAQAGLVETSFAYKLFIADIDHDGKPDLLSVGQGLAMTDGPDRCGLVALLSSPVGPRLQPATVLPCGQYEAVLGSLDRPGQLELVILDTPFTTPATPVAPRLHFYTLDTQGRPTINKNLASASLQVCAGFYDCFGLMLMDVNGDGLQDLVLGAQFEEHTGSTLVFTRDTNGIYKEYLRQNFGNAYALLVTDADRDGRDDIMTVVQSLAGSGIGLGRSLQTPGMEMSHLIPMVVFDTMNPSTVAVADLDGDGLPDIVLDSYNTGLSVLFQRGH